MTEERDILLRIPPNDLRAEQSVLGAILLRNEAIERVLEIISGDDFYRESHREIFRSMAELTDHSQPVDAITLTDALRTKGVLEQIGGHAYIAELAGSEATAGFAPQHAKIIREKSILRRLISAGTTIAADAFEQRESGGELLQRAEAQIFEIADRRSQSAFSSTRELAPATIREIEWREQHRGQVTGLATGIGDLDRLTSGLQPGDLNVIAARPSMGKTALALNITTHVAMNVGAPVGVAVFSLESSKAHLMTRMVATEARVSSTRLRAGFLAAEEYERLGRATSRIADAPIFIDDSSDLTPPQLRAKIRRLFRQQKGAIGLVVVDYLQLMNSAQRHRERRDLEIGEITKALKALAKEFHVPVLALSQLNRQTESRQDKRPTLADLRESGAIEQDADVVAFIYRREFYDGEKCPLEERGVAELILGKDRNGARATVRATFIAELMLFGNLDRSSANGAIDSAHEDRRCPPESAA